MMDRQAVKDWIKEYLEMLMVGLRWKNETDC